MILQDSKNENDCNSLIRQILTLSPTLRDRTYRNYQDYSTLYRCGIHLWNSVPVIAKMKNITNELEILRKLLFK